LTHQTFGSQDVAQWEEVQREEEQQETAQQGPALGSIGSASSTHSFAFPWAKTAHSRRAQRAALAPQLLLHFQARCYMQRLHEAGLRYTRNEGGYKNPGLMRGCKLHQSALCFHPTADERALQNPRRILA
jgi:hypothetical protein